MEINYNFQEIALAFVLEQIKTYSNIVIYVYSLMLQLITYYCVNSVLAEWCS